MEEGKPTIVEGTTPREASNVFVHNLEQARMRSDIRVLLRQYEDLQDTVNTLLTKVETIDHFVSLHANDMKDLNSEVTTIKDIIGKRAFRKKK